MNVSMSLAEAKAIKQVFGAVKPENSDEAMAQVALLEKAEAVIREEKRKEVEPKLAAFLKIVNDASELYGIKIAALNDELVAYPVDDPKMIFGIGDTDNEPEDDSEFED